MTLTLSRGPGDEEEEDDDQELTVAPIPLSNARNLADGLTDMVAFRKGAMYDYCILRAIECIFPDPISRKVFMDAGKPIAGLDAVTQTKGLGEGIESLTIKWKGQVMVQAKIRSMIYPRDAKGDARAVVEMLDFECIDGNNKHIYGGDKA
jgi:hypothetical protein